MCRKIVYIITVNINDIDSIKSTVTQTHIIILINLIYSKQDNSKNEMLGGRIYNYM